MDSEEKIVHEYKNQKNFTSPDIFLTAFNANAADQETRFEILKKEISVRGITGDAIILNGEGVERSIYFVKQGSVIEDNLFKGMPLTSLNIPENLMGVQGKLENTSVYFQQILHESIEKTAFSQFAEEQVTKILFDLTDDLHLSFYYLPDKIKKDAAFIKETKKFTEETPNAAIDQYGFYEFPRKKGEEGTSIPPMIGYLCLNRIYDPTKDAGVKQRAFEIMKKMQDKNAIVIDVRTTGGGTPEGVKYLLSFFFKNPTPLNKVHMKLSENKYSDKEFSTLSLSELNPDRNSDQIVDLSEKPVYILVGPDTFSAAEELAYDMQQLGRATIVGDLTKGGVHPCELKPLFDPVSTDVTFNGKFCLIVPNAISINPYSNTNWEDGPKKEGNRPGVSPDKGYEISKGQSALELVCAHIISVHLATENLLSTAKTANVLGIQQGGLRTSLGNQLAVLDSKEGQSITSSAISYPLAMQNNMSVTTKMGGAVDGAQDAPKCIPPKNR